VEQQARVPRQGQARSGGHDTACVPAEQCNAGAFFQPADARADRGECEGRAARRLSHASAVAGVKENAQICPVKPHPRIMRKEHKHDPQRMIDGAHCQFDAQ
jgi:hypothetical protein